MFQNCAYKYFLNQIFPNNKVLTEKGKYYHFSSTLGVCRGPLNTVRCFLIFTQTAMECIERPTMRAAEGLPSVLRGPLQASREKVPKQLRRHLPFPLYDP